MLTDISLTTISDDKRSILNETLADLGFPSVYELEAGTLREYRSILADAWPQCDQTEEDAHAFDLAHAAIDHAFRA